MFKGLCLLVVLTLSNFAFASEKSICGENDDRALSFNSKVGRLFQGNDHKGCTVTMISDKCGISAGHCLRVIKNAEFNTPVSIDNEPQPSDPRDIYSIDQDSIQYDDNGPGKDWAVFKLKENVLTKRLPGEIQGYYNVATRKPRKGASLRITGYGADHGDLDKNFAQQTHTGKLESTGSIFYGRSIMTYTVDTMGGNSGSSIIHEGNQEVVGIHTHGGCRSNGGSNKGTLIARNPELQKAIAACLK